MRLLSLILLSASAVAQQSLTTTFASNNGQSGNMFDIEVVAPITITDFDVNLDAGTWDIEVYRPTAGGSYVPIGLTASAWTLVEAIPGVVGAGVNVPTTLGMSVPIQILPGQLEGIYITVSNGTAMNYTNGSATGSLYVSDPFVSVYEGAGKSYPFGSNFNPRVWNGTIYYSVGTGNVALNTTLGVGGGGSSIGDGSAYELFPSGFDLANSSHTYIWIGDGYIVLPGAAPIAPTAGAAVVALSDDSVAPVSLPFDLPCPRGFLDTLYLCSNGWLSFEATTSADYTESLAEFLANESRLCFLWDDLNPAAGGQVTADVDPSNPSVFHITFTNVPEFGSSNQNTVQVSLFDNGNIEVKYGAIALGDCMVGLTTGNGATDPGPSDYSNLPTLPIGPFTTGQELLPVRLVGDTRPVIGTSWDLTCDNNQPGTVFGVSILGLSDPMINDLGLVGVPMPGNPLRASLDLIQGPYFLAPGANGFSYSVALPNLPTLVGLELFTQGAAFGGFPNPFDAQTSNGIKGTLGDI